MALQASVLQSKEPATETPGMGFHFLQDCCNSVIRELKPGHLLTPGHRPLQVEEETAWSIHLLEVEEARSYQSPRYSLPQESAKLHPLLLEQVTRGGVTVCTPVSMSLILSSSSSAAILSLTVKLAVYS